MSRTGRLTMRSGMNGLMGVALAATALAAGAEPAPMPNLSPGMLPGTPSLDLRLRAEHADNDSAVQTEEAQATTLRARLGFTTVPWSGFDLRLEYEGVSALDKYDYNTTL